MKKNRLLKRCVPPVLFDLWKRVHLKDSLYYFNDFRLWEEAMAESDRLGGNYADQSIVEKVDESTQRVRRGEALYEQDGVCFFEENNNWELLASLFYAKSVLGDITVLDMGGALGSTWFRYRKLIEDVAAKWCVVEQQSFVERGKKNVPEIPFFYTIEEAITSCKPNVLLLSSVLMYLDDPYKWFKEMLSKDFAYIIIDENAFLTDENSEDRIMLQHVPTSIYRAIYPLHIFGEKRFRNFIEKNGYEIVWEWQYRGGSIPIKNKLWFSNTVDKGFLLKKKSV